MLSGEATKILKDFFFIYKNEGNTWDASIFLMSAYRSKENYENFEKNKITNAKVKSDEKVLSLAKII